MDGEDGGHHKNRGGDGMVCRHGRGAEAVREGENMC